MTPLYRRLPGTRRGFLNRASVWAGPDHLLLVRGTRFREAYKRFYFRDVQALAVARAPRFHISTRSGLIAYLLLLAAFGASAPIFAGRTPYLLPAIGLILLALAGAWVLVSALQSCRCRIYTAVSSDELPSVYRLWTARKFLAAVEPLIGQTQGTLAGEWAEAAETRTVGPAIPSGPATEAAPVRLPRRDLSTDLFLFSLAVDAFAKLVPVPGAFGTWLPFGMEMLTVAAAVGVIVQYNRGRLRSGMNRLAVASLVGFGILYYVQSMNAGVTAAFTAAKTGKRTVATAFPQSRPAQELGAGLDAILIVVGLILSLREDQPDESQAQRSMFG